LLPIPDYPEPRLFEDVGFGVSIYGNDILCPGATCQVLA